MATSATHTSSIRGITPSMDVLFKGYVKQKKRILADAQRREAMSVIPFLKKRPLRSISSVRTL
jgi:hypothetical protein